MLKKEDSEFLCCPLRVVSVDSEKDFLVEITSAEIKSIATSKFFVHSCNFHSPLLQIQQGQHLLRKL